MNPSQAAKLIGKVELLGLVGDVRALVREREAVLDASKSKRHCKSGGQASKAKGRDGCQMLQTLILESFPALQPDDVLVKATSQGGVDLHLSPRAQECFPFGPEAKRTESLNVWAALKQAEINAAKKGLPALLYFSRAHSGGYIAVSAADFMSLLRGLPRGE